MTILHRRDPAKRMARFYRVSLQPALPFNDAPACDLVREWGRIGQGGRVRADAFADQTAAACAQEQLLVTKRKRGYL